MFVPELNNTTMKTTKNKLIPVTFSFFISGEWKELDALFRPKDRHIIIGSHTCCPIEDFGDYKMVKKA